MRDRGWRPGRAQRDVAGAAFFDFVNRLLFIRGFRGGKNLKNDINFLILFVLSSRVTTLSTLQLSAVYLCRVAGPRRVGRVDPRHHLAPQPLGMPLAI